MTVGVIVFLLQIDTLGAEKSRRDNYLQKRPACSGAGPARRAWAAGNRVNLLERYDYPAARFNVSEAARQLGLTRAQMAYRLKRNGLL